METKIERRESLSIEVTAPPAVVEHPSTYRYSRQVGAQTLTMAKRLRQDRVDLDDFEGVVERLGVDRLHELYGKYFPEMVRVSTGTPRPEVGGPPSRSALFQLVCPCKCFGINE